MVTEQTEQAGHNPWLVAASVMLGTFMVVLDTTVVNVSLPHIAGSLSASVEESTWALTSYLAANAIILPITGWLANLLGRKRLFLISVGSFTTASLLCGLAPSLPVLILWRIVQGASGGVMQPLSQAVMLEAFPPHERGKAMGFFGIGIVVAPILGPVLGGWLTDSYSWRWVFYINIPIGILAIVLLRAFLHDPPYLKRGYVRIDYVGIGLLTLGIGALQIMLDKGQEEDWLSSHFITILLVIAVVCLALFVLHELVVRDPVVKLRAFADRTFATGTFLITLMGFGLYGSLVMMPVLLQTVMGYPPLQAGIAMAPRGVGTLVAMPVVGLMMSRTDPRLLMGLGFGLSAFTMLWLSWLTLDAGYWDFFWPQIVQGIAFGLLFVPLATTSVDAISRQEMGNATSLFNLMRNIGGSVGIATVQTLLARDRQVHTNIMGTHITSYSPQAQATFQGLRSLFLSRGADVTTATRRASAAMFGMVQKQAAMMSFLDTFRILAMVLLVMVPLVLLLRRPRHQTRAPAVAAE
ncbi:MAG TPA: DHA2 family efflux MFS transporter permease subunit [Thermoanaerobaculaceae bacterium]|nr:DHA2 family efflux MFS transporter permease subunit [Thermoanaerobaculaceae bacterium]HPS78639.1 DHA2 family efflux MFS transporter permease subunit [Thermoanaerobaculaceae bacterium]